MPRIRTIKPSFWKDQKLGKMKRDVRLMFIGLWNLADDEGVIHADASIVRSELFAFDEDLRVNTIQGWLDQLTESRMIVPFTFNGEGYYVIRNFKVHQVINRPQESKIPLEIIKNTLSEHSVNGHGTITAGREEEGKGKEREEEGSTENHHSLNGASSKKEKLKKSVAGARDHSFSESEFYPIEKFESEFEGTDYANCDLKYYHERMKNWAESKDVKRKDWIATARNFMLGDADQKKLRLKSGVKNGTEESNLSYQQRLVQGYRDVAGKR